MFFKFFICGLTVLICSCSAYPVVTQKIKGVSFVSSKDTINQNHINPVLAIHANFAAVMPYGFLPNLEHPEVYFNTERQWYGERYLGAKQYISTLQKNNIQVMLKPQIWVWQGAFTGDLLMKSEEDWQLLEKSYESFILLYAQLAQEQQVALFCIGTELYNFVEYRPLFWDRLINKVREIYSGKITYAENWDKVNYVTFWDQLDYIGVDAYYPVAKSLTPSVSESRKGWQKHKNMLQSLSRKHELPILFTEFGYRSTDFAGKEPWASQRHEGKMNAEAQAYLFKALFEEFWDESWFAGGFVWKWFHDHERVIREENNRFTPQGKMAENVLKDWYSKD